MKLRSRYHLMGLLAVIFVALISAAAIFGRHHLALWRDIGSTRSNQRQAMTEMPVVAADDSKFASHRLDSLNITLPLSFRDESANGFTSFGNDDVYITSIVDDPTDSRDLLDGVKADIGKDYPCVSAFERDCYSAMNSPFRWGMSGNEARTLLYLRSWARLSGMNEVKAAEYYAGAVTEGLLRIYRDGTLSYRWQLKASGKTGCIHFCSRHEGQPPDMELVRAICQSISEVESDLVE